MTPEWQADEEALLSEFNDPNTPWERKAHILLTLAYKASSRGEIGLELTYLESALEIAKTHKLISHQIHLRITLARVMLNVQGNPQGALDYALEAEAMLPEFTLDHDELQKKAALANIMGKILVAFDRLAEATHQYKMQAELNEMLKVDRGVASGWEKAAECLVEMGELDQAEQLAEKAKAIYLEYALPADICDVDRILARVMLAKGMAKPARDLLISVRNAERALNDGSRTETKLWLGISFIATGEFERAERYLQRVRKGAYKPWQREFKIAKQASEALANLLFQLGRDSEARAVIAQSEAVDSRLPKVGPDNKPFQEIQNLLESNQADAALIAAGELVVLKCEEGDIAGRWQAHLAEVNCYREQGDYMAIVTLWDTLSNASLEFQDHIVIPLKNMVSHALYKVDRLEEASALNEAVLSDYRLAENIQEKAYAQENKARILKALKKNVQAKKWADSAIENNILIGNNDRALNILKSFKNGRGSSDPNGNPENYK